MDIEGKIVKDQPIRAEFSNLIWEEKHKHEETEIILVLRGSLKCKINCLDYLAEKGDMVITEKDDLHQIYFGTDDLIYLSLFINMEDFKYLHPNLVDMVFVCEKHNLSRYDKKAAEYKEKLDLLRQAMINIAEAYFEKTGDLHLMTEDLIKLLIEKYRGFFIYKNNFFTMHGETTTTDLDRIERIIRYICDNVDKKITLEEVAEMEHLNSYYLSHLITKKFGTSFQGLINYLRLEEAEKLLLKPELSLTQISNFCGFSSLQYMKKCFLDYFEVTPQEYRRQLKTSEKAYGKPFKLEEAIRLLEDYQGEETLEAKRKSEIKIDLAHVKPIRKFRKNFMIEAKDIEELSLLLNFIEEIKSLRNTNIIVGFSEKEMKKNLVISQIIKNLGDAGLNVESSEKRTTEIEENSIIQICKGQEVSVGVSSLVREGRLTYLFGGLHLLSSIDGDVLYDGKHQYIVRGENKIHILAENNDRNKSMKFEIALKEVFLEGIMVKRTVEDFSDLKDGGNKELIEHINKATLGNVKFQNVKALGELNVLIEGKPKTITWVSFDL